LFNVNKQQGCNDSLYYIKSVPLLESTQDALKVNDFGNKNALINEICPQS